MQFEIVAKVFVYQKSCLIPIFVVIEACNRNHRSTDFQKLLWLLLRARLAGCADGRKFPLRLIKILENV